MLFGFRVLLWGFVTVAVAEIDDKRVWELCSAAAVAMTTDVSWYCLVVADGVDNVSQKLLLLQPELSQQI